MSRQPIKLMRATANTWAIETRLKPEYWHNYLNELALFHTRRAARNRLALLKIGYRLPQAARAVRVAVTITTIGRG